MKNYITRGINKIQTKLMSDVLHQLKDINTKMDNILQSQAFDRQVISRMHELATLHDNKSILKLDNNQILVKIYNGLKMYLDIRDIAVVPHIALDGIWEREITKAWVDLIKPQDVVVDIGANFGYFGLLAAHKLDKKNSKVIFIEANPNLIPYIQKTLSLNWYNEQSTIGNFAVSDKKGSITLNVLEDYIGSSSTQSMEQLSTYLDKKMNLKVSEAIKVPMMTLDEYCRQENINELNIIKMDIEGSEESAYAGMREIVGKSSDITMFMEFTKEAYRYPKKFYDQMLKDFGSVYIIDKSGVLVKPKNSSYQYVIGEAEDWTMPVFSKNNTLDKGR